jgi:hypothetical protein
MRSTTLLASLAGALWLGACAGGEGAAAPAEPAESVSVATQCDKVTTFVCPGDPCLCMLTNCALVNHNGDFAPCNGPPPPGCMFDFSVQYCFPPGMPIPCDPAHVPVNHCGEPCRDGPVSYGTDANGCCRGVRLCLPPLAPIGAASFSVGGECGSR